MVRGRGVSWGTLAAIVVAGALLAGAVLAMTALQDRVDQTRDFNDTFDGTTTVVVEGDSAQIQIGVSPSGQSTTVRAQLRWNTVREPLYTSNFDGTVLRLRMGRCGLRIFGSYCESSLTLTVPQTVDLRVRNDSGDVRVSGVRGPVSVSADSADVELTDLAGPLSIELDSGRLDGDRLTSTRVEATLDSGSVTLAFLTAPAEVRARTDSGQITIAVPSGSGAYGVQASADSGQTHVDVATATGTGRQINAETDSGNITIQYHTV